MNLLVFCLFSYPILILSNSIELSYLDLIHQNLRDFHSFNQFYQNFLHDIRQHRIIDTVVSPINLEKIRLNTYTEDDLKNSCFETASDLLYAHGYDPKNLNLSKDDLRLLLPAILNTVENSGCERQLPPTKQYPLLNRWVSGILLILFMKLIHFIVFSLSGEHSSALTSNGITRILSTHAEALKNPSEDVRVPPVKYHLWLGLAFNAFTCGIILGTVIYHLIPHIYEIPNEDFSYTYLLRGTVVLFGIFLFFIVEKLLRFRFRVDEMQFEPTTDENTDQPVVQSSDGSMIQIARMHGTFHVNERDHVHHGYSESAFDVEQENIDEQTDLQTNTNHRHSSHHEVEKYKQNLTLYHVIYDLTNDLIYGCGFATAMSHDYFIGLVLWLMILSEGFRRHSQLLTSIGRKLGLKFLYVSFVCLLLGYLIGGMIVEMHQQFNIQTAVLQKEYIYSIVYGALFYTALVILIPELNDFGQHLQDLVKDINQTAQQRRLLKGLILLCQNIFLIIGVLIALMLAILWRYYHRIHVSQYVCQRDPFRIICSGSS